MRTYLILAGGFLAIALGQTMLGPGQLANAPKIVGQFGFNCFTVGSGTTCAVDQSYILNLILPCASASLPCPPPAPVAPKPGPCPSTGSVILTNEPAAYFCVQTSQFASNLNWIRVAGVNTW
jgi:hypothetical protein